MLDSLKVVGNVVLFFFFVLFGIDVQYKYSFNSYFSEYGFVLCVFYLFGVYVVNFFVKNNFSSDLVSEMVVV